MTAELKITKLAGRYRIFNVESVRIGQEMCILDWQRDPEDLYREITTGERRDPETQNERDRARLIARGEVLFEDRADGVVTITCPTCEGRRVADDGARCPRCGGVGIIRKPSEAQ